MPQQVKFGETPAAAMEQLPCPCGMQDKVQALGTMAAESHTRYLLQRGALILVSFAAAWGSLHSTPGAHVPPITTGHHSTLCSPDLCWVGAAPNSQSGPMTNAPLSPAPQEIQ